MTPEALSPAEAAAFIGCSLRHFQQHFAPHLPFSDLRAPGARKPMPRYRVSVLRELLATHEVQPK
jgi:hypothetical protein